MSFELQLTFHGDLGRFFLSPRMRGKARIFREMREKTSVKDIIESCGVPHPEVDLIVLSTGLQKALAIDFQGQLENSGNLDIYGFPAPRDLFPSGPRLQSRYFAHFVADGHLGKLSRNLRLLGVDTSYESDADDKRLLEIMLSENRALLTRDRRLLMHSVVRHGFCPRSSHPEEQTHEVLQRFGLLESPKSIAPFSRCLECNGLLRDVDKAAVSQQLAAEPRTLQYYDSYRRCPICQRIFWAGSHFTRLAARVARLAPIENRSKYAHE